MNIYVVIGIFSGVVDEVEAFYSEDSANAFEQKLCQQCGVPYDKGERAKYHDSGGEHDVLQYTLEVK